MADFSTKQYSWKDLTITIGGRILEGVTDIEYSEKQEKDIQRGRGFGGHGILRGNKTYEGKITVWQSELEAMTRDAPNKDILALSFGITMSYVPDGGGTSVTDIIPVAEFLNNKKAFKQGDKQMLVELPIIFYEVKRQE